jgi:hypothetical protein
MAEENLNDVAQEKAGLPDDDQLYDDIEENDFLTPPIEPHDRNDLE